MHWTLGWIFQTTLPLRVNLCNLRLGIWLSWDPCILRVLGWVSLCIWQSCWRGWQLRVCCRDSPWIGWFCRGSPRMLPIQIGCCISWVRICSYLQGKGFSFPKCSLGCSWLAVGLPCWMPCSMLSLVIIEKLYLHRRRSLPELTFEILWVWAWVGIYLFGLVIWSSSPSDRLDRLNKWAVTSPFLHDFE